ncbi:ATP-binding protein [Marinobacter sp. CHS3-4]|uniref:sensor histidine kinase n=1 Tax=Marinobacter sp. CHS3-4 TaxID=3045174 RepID=UPI0024B5CB2A|nr:ATP-binding protein [Marinobacter sp. CHS3-4]MDI9244021.1 ATP-binding protein [Marinobacter sp. CHS3-4]
MTRLSLGIGSRLAVIIVCFSLTAIIAVAVTAYRALNEDFESILTERQAYEARRVSEQVSGSLQLRIALLEALGTSLTDGEKLLPIQEIETFLGRQDKLQALFSNGLLVLDENATAIAEDTFVPNRIGTNYADRSHFARAIESRQSAISRPIIGRTTGVPLLSFVSPIESAEGDLLGFLAGSINLNKTNLIPPDALRLSKRQQAELLVVDTDNFLYVETKEDEEGIKSLPAPGKNPLIDAALSGLTLGEVKTENGDIMIYATSHLERLGWLFIRAVPKAYANAPATESFNKFLWASILIVLIVLPIGYLVTRSAMAPLNNMTRRIGRMSAAGGSSTRVEETGPPEVRNLARAFNRLQDERDAIAKLQEDFISNVSHELRTPLTSINGALRLIESGTLGELPEKAADMSKLALRNGERLQRLISDLLDFNKLNSGEVRLALEFQRLAPIVSQAINGNHAMAQEHNVKLESDCEPGLVVHTDAHRLRQILDNFISNAIKYSPTGGRVRLVASRTDEGKIRLTVSDQGEGVPESFKHQLFRRFAQAETGTKRASKGTGLGLAICRELATLLGGEIGVYNDHGAHFWIDLAPDTTSQEGQ